MQLTVPGGESGVAVSVMAWPEDGLRAHYVVVHYKDGGAYLHTAFPAAAGGSRHPIRIDSIHEVSCGLEARISGVLGDAAITFFDPLYPLNRDRYRRGSVVDVELAGIAYSMKIVPGGTKVKTPAGDVPLAGAAVLIGAGKDGGERNQRSFGDENAFGVAYIEHQNGVPFPDDYSVCAAVKEVEQGAIGSIPVWKYRSTVMRVHEGRHEVDIDIYATPQSMAAGAVATRGDEVSGTLWLQGTLPSR